MSAKRLATEFVGKKINNLTIVKDLRWPTRDRAVLAQCICGKVKVYLLNNIERGRSKSCGCSQVRPITHGLSKHRLYWIFTSMSDRCKNTKARFYHRYGGRGIKICSEWEHNFKKFYDWAIQNGWQEGLEIDRINNDGNYEPSNCRWATDKEECRNRSTNKIIEFNGEKRCVAEWCELHNITQQVFYKRRKRGWDIKRALESPLMKNKFVYQ